ncbi:hypothetical protein SLE2022_022800 [Rubroshorea leprosula]
MMKTSTLPLDPPSSAVTSAASDHNSLCFSLTEQLIQRGLVSSAHQVIQRLIANSSSLSEAISAAEFADVRGLGLNVGCYAALIQKLMQSGQTQLAHLLYYNSVIGRVLLEEFFARGMFLDAFDCFVRMTDSGVTLDFWCYRKLFTGLCYRRHLMEAMQMFDIMRERTRLLPRLRWYKTLFYGLCKGGCVKEAELLVGQMESQGFFVDRSMYTSLMNAYSKDKKMKMAMGVYLRMLKMGFQPDSYSCNTLIHGFVKMGLFDKGWLLYNQMMEQGVQPNVVTYHVMISSYCKNGKVDCAFMVLDNMVSNKIAPTVHCYTVLLASLYKENRLMEVDEMYNTMLDRGVVPDHILFFTIMKMYPKGYQLQVANMILRAIALSGCGFDPSLLSSSTTGSVEEEIQLLLEEIVKSNPSLAEVAFSIHIIALCEEGKLDDSLCCMDKMINLGFMPSIFVYNSLIKCLCREGLFEDAKSLIYLLQEQCIVPDQKTFLIMINEYSKQGDLASAFDIFYRMEEKGVKPDVAIYDCIIGGLGRENRMLEAENMFVKMLESGLDPDEVAYRTMIDSYLKNKRPTEACELFEKMVQNAVGPSSLTYSVLIAGLVMNDMTEKGHLYLDRMLGDGLFPNAILYTSLVKHFTRRGDFEFAFRLLDLMEKNKIECDPVRYITLVIGVCRGISGRKSHHFVNGRSEREIEMFLCLLNKKTGLPRKNNLRISAVPPEGMKIFMSKLMQKVIETPFMPNLCIYNVMIDGFCHADRMQDAYDHFELMQKEGFHPNQVTYTMLIGGHIRSGEIDHAIGLFNKMNADGCTPDECTYNTLLKGLCRFGRLLDALSLFVAMRKRGFFPSQNCYDNLLMCLCASCLTISAFKIFEEMIDHDFAPRPYSYNWLLSILCAQKQLNEAFVVLDVMLQRGKVPYRPTQRLLVETFSKEKLTMDFTFLETRNFNR